MSDPKAPIGWREVRLGDVVFEDKQKANRSDASRPFIGLENIESETGAIRSGSSAPEDAGAFLFDERHVLYSKLRPYLNKVALPDFRGRCSTEAIPLLCKKDIERRYLAAFLRRRDTLNAVMGEKTGSRMPRADMRVLLDLKISLPPLQEQRRICNILDAALLEVTAAREAVVDGLTSANKLAGAVFADLISAGRWPAVPLLELCECKGQYGLSLKAHAEPVGYPMLRMGNIQDGAIDLSDLTYIELSENDYAAYRICAGDILFNRTNSAELVGKTAYVGADLEAVFASYIVRFRLKKDRADGRYVAQMINSPIGREFIEREMGRAVGQVNISAGKMHTFPVPLPGLDEQQRIMDKVSSLTAVGARAASALKRQRNEIAAIPQSLLSAAFQGEL